MRWNEVEVWGVDPKFVRDMLVRHAGEFPAHGAIVYWQAHVMEPGSIVCLSNRRGCDAVLLVGQYHQKSVHAALCAHANISALALPQNPRMGVGGSPCLPGPSSSAISPGIDALCRKHSTTASAVLL